MSLTDIFSLDGDSTFEKTLERVRGRLVVSATAKVCDAAKMSRINEALGFSETTVRRSDFDHREPQNSGWSARMCGHIEGEGAVVRSLPLVRGGIAAEVGTLSLHDIQTINRLVWLPVRPYHPLEALAREADDDPQADLV